MHESLEQLTRQNTVNQLDISEFDGNITNFKEKIGDVLGDFRNPEQHGVKNINTTRVNKSQKFYTHIVQDLYFQDLEKLPNERKNYVYKYLRRFLIPIIKKGTLGIHTGRPEKTKKQVTDYGIHPNKLVNDKIEKNPAYVYDYINQETNELNDRFNEKLEEYYGMYETVITKRIQKEIIKLNDNNKNLNEMSIRKLLINIANEFTFILKAFSDKLNLVDFEKLFLKSDYIDNTNDGPEGIIGICKSITTIYESLKYEKKPYDSTLGISEEYHDLVENEEEKRYNDLLEMCKSFVPSGLVTNQNEIQFSNNLLAKNIEKHFEDIFLDIADIYKHWLYSEDMSIEGLEKISATIFRLYDNYITIESKDIAFIKRHINSFIIKVLDKIKSDNIRVSDILSQEYEYESFLRLCTIGYNIDQYQGTYTLEKEIEYKEERYNRLQLLCGEIKNKKKEQNKHIEFIDISETPLEDLDFDLFNQAGPIKRKKYFLDNVYIRDKERNIIGHNFDEVIDETGEDSEELINFAIYYSEKHKSYRTQEDKVISDLKLVLNELKSSKINTYKFQENNIYYEQLLVSWFRYNLALKKYGKSNEKIAKILNEEMYGPKELLLNDFGQKISSSNISFRNGGSENKLHNTSIWNIDELIEKYELRFNKRPINLNDEENFGVKNNQERGVKNILMKDISSLYLPNIKKGKTLEYEDIKNYLDGIEEYSVGLLQRKNLTDEKYKIYGDIFERYGIEPSDFDQIGKIRKFLKYAQYILPIAHELSKKSQSEQEAINELYNIVGNDMVTQDTYKFEVGEPKDLKRIFEKIIGSYSGDIREMGDLARMRYVGNTMDDCYEKMNTMIRSIKTNPILNDYIVQGIVEDSVGNNSERGPKKTQYRDLKLQFKNDKGILIEVQFIVKEMFEWKEEGLPEEELNEIMIHQNLDLGQDFIDELERRADAEGILIPQFLLTIFEADVIIHKEKFKKYDTKINSDLFYKLHRGSGNKHFKMIMAHLESVVYDRQRGKVIAKQSRKLDNQEEMSA